MLNPFATPAMAEGYALARPPLHGRIVERACELIGLRDQVPVALDLGCGSGLSIRPLLRVARKVIGIDPAHAMVVIANQLASPAQVVTAKSEALPIRSGSVDLITAAGSLNYSTPSLALPELARVLARGGACCVYDFSQGRGSVSCPGLAEWFSEFEQRYPRPPSEALYLDPQVIADLAQGFEVAAKEEFQIELPMTHDTYVNYLMTETNVAAAIRAGGVESELKRRIAASLYEVFDGATVDVLFTGYIVCLRAA